VQEDKSRSFCSSIYVYNFLSESLKYEREGDIGYLIARIFINSENHFFVDGRKQLGFLFNDFVHAVLTKEVLQQIAEATIVYSLNIDPFTPPYDMVKQISVKEIKESALQSKIITGKRLGFQFNIENKKED
jgi:hypothetical protein